VLVGRGKEQQAISDLLAAARDSHGGSLVIRGIAGSGKSTLLDDAVALASDMRVLRTQGVESESPLAFAALQRLLWPLRRQLDELPKQQADALGGALGEREGEGDRFLTFLGVLSLLADAAEKEPLLVCVDDAQWLDEASAAGLLFVARRLQAERMALLFGVRDEESSSLDTSDLPTIVLAGIAADDAATLLASARGTEKVDPAVCDALLTATAGNPLALVELAGALDAEHLTGERPLPSQLPHTDGVERAFGDRYRRLGDGGRKLLLVAAADDTGQLTIVREAAERFGAGDDALDEVERAGLLRVDAAAVTLYHPLVRSAVYRAATNAERRAAHRALADALSNDADRRAWHLAAATDRPDEAVVADLDAVAERAAARGGREAAAAAWARAAELTTDASERGRRHYLAAASAWAGAQPVRAAAFAAAASGDVADPVLRARLLLLRGQIEWNTRSLDNGYDFVVQAAQVVADADPAMAQRLAMLAASLSNFGARSSREFDPTSVVAPPSDDSPGRVRAAFHMMNGFRAVARADYGQAAQSYRSAFALADAEPPEEDNVLLPNLGIAAWLIDDDERALRLHETQLTTSRRGGALNMVEHALTRMFQTQIATGAWTSAASGAAEGLRLAESTGNTGLAALPTAQLALIAALRGDAAAEAHIGAVAAIRQAHAIGITDPLVVDLAHWATGLRSGSEPATALHHLEQMQLPMIRRLAILDVFDIAFRAGHYDVVRAWLEEIEAFAAGTGIASAVAVAAHGRALLDANHAERHFDDALAAHADSPRLPNRARTALAFGEYLRRARRRVDAREHLRVALTTFEELGATPLAERAAQELRASGETARRREAASSDELTPQERQVAGLVRQGLSNRDAAAQLFLSPRTVDFHLRNVFHKLGVTSRAELAAMQLD
jgi:DNA-binding CsgD family transcriptional regulator